MSTTSPTPSAAPEGRRQVAPTQPPVERGVPLLGIFPALFRDGPDEFARIAEKHWGEIPIVHVGPVSFRLLTHPSQIQYVLQENWRNYTRNSRLWTPLRELLGEGVLFSEGELWRKRRRLMQPFFGVKHIDGLVGSVVTIVKRHLDRLDEVKAGEPVDMVKEMGNVMMSLALEAMFGVRADERHGRAAVDAFLRGQRVVGLHMLLSGLPRWIPRPGQATLDEIKQIFTDVILESVRQVRASPERPATDVLTLLVRARDEETGEMLDDQALRDELVTLFAAANDDSAKTLAWLWYALDQNPAVVTKLRAEIEQVLEGRDPTVEDLARMPYTRQVIQESMRRYTSVPMTLRIALDDDIIGSSRIAKGEPLVIAPYAVQMNRHVWDRPRVFDPDRWSAEPSASRDRFAFVAFGGGPRKCIGVQLAMMELAVVVAMMLQRFNPRLVPGHRPVRPFIEGAIIVPKPGLSMNLNPLPRRS